MSFRDLRQAFFWLVIVVIRQATHKVANGCQNCLTLAEILAWTEGELRTARKELAEAKHKLQKITALSESAAKASATEMGAGNVPRGRYGYLKAQNDLGNQVLSILGIKPYRVRKKINLGWLGRL